MDLEEDLFGHYDNLALYRPSKVLIHGLKYDVDAATHQACFYIQDIDETSACFRQPPTLFLWQSKKTFVTLFDESHLPYQLNKQRHQIRRTFKRRTKRTGEGCTYDVKEDIIKRIENYDVSAAGAESSSSSITSTTATTTTTTTNLREFTWSTKSVNTDDKYILVRLAEEENDESKNTRELIRKFPTTYGINMLHDDMDTVDGAGDGKQGMSSFTNDILPGTLAQLTYFTEKLIHIDPIRSNTESSSVCTPSETSFVSSNDFDSHYEAENLNLNVSFDPAVMWVTPYEDRVGLQTSLFQLSEKFGDTYESHVYKLTTSGRYSTDVSLSMAEVKHYMPRNDELDKSLQFMPGDAIVVDSVKDNKKMRNQLTSSDNEDFEELDFDVNDIPSIQVNDRAVRKSDFRNSRLKQRLASEEIFYFEDETTEVQTNPNPTEKSTESSRNTTESYMTTFDIEEIEIFDSADVIVDRFDQEVNNIKKENHDGASADRIDGNKNDNDNDVASYINGKYGVDFDCTCDDNDESEDLIGFDDVDHLATSSKHSTDNVRASLLELAKNVDINLKRLSVNDDSEEEDADTPNIQYSGDKNPFEGDISYDGDENNIQLYDAYTDDTNNEKNMPIHVHDNNGGSRSDSNLCTCYYDDIDDGPSSDMSSDIPDQPSPSNWVYPPDPLTTPSPPPPLPPPPLNVESPTSDDDESSSSDILLDLNSFILPECKTPSSSTGTKRSTENGSDSGFETTNTNGNDRQTPDDDDINNLPPPPPSIINHSETDNQLIISLSSDEDEITVTNKVDRKTKNESRKIPTTELTDTENKLLTNFDNSTKIDPEMNSFITSIQGLLDKNWIIENPEDSVESTIQQRSKSNKRTSTKRRSLLDISRDHTPPETKLTEDEERMKRVVDYLTSRKNILINNSLDDKRDNRGMNTVNAEPGTVYRKPGSVATAPDMDSFINAVKEMSANNEFITKSPVADSCDEDIVKNKETAYQEGVLDREKSESLISLESEEEYLQLPSVRNNKSINSILSVEEQPIKSLCIAEQPMKTQYGADNHDNSSDQLDSDCEILNSILSSYGDYDKNGTNNYRDNNSGNNTVEVCGDEEDLRSFLASIKKLALKKLKIENVNIDDESTVEEKKSKLLKKQKSLLELATEKGLLNLSTDDVAGKNEHKLQNIYDDTKATTTKLLANRKKKKTSAVKYENKVKPEADMTAFVSAVRCINTTPYNYIKTPDCELELPACYTDRDSHSGSLRGFAELPRSKRSSLHSSTPDLSRHSDIAKHRDETTTISDKIRFLGDNNIRHEKTDQSVKERKSSLDNNRDRISKSVSCHDLSSKAPSTSNDNFLSFSLATRPPPTTVQKSFTEQSCESTFNQSVQEEFVTIEDTTITDNSLKDISDFSYVHIPVPPGNLTQSQVPHSALPRYEPFVHIHSPTTTSFNKEERSSSITSEWDDVFDGPTSGKSTPTNNVMTEKFHDATHSAHPSSSFEINARQEPGFVLDMKSYMLSARDLPGNELVTQNPIRGLKIIFLLHLLLFTKCIISLSSKHYTVLAKINAKLLIFLSEIIIVVCLCKRL